MSEEKIEVKPGVAVIPPETPKPDGRKGPKGVKAEEFAEFKGEVMGMFEKLMTKIDGQPKAAVVDVMKEEAAPDKNRVSVPPSWTALVEQILGPEFGCEYELPPDGGQKFTILVPKEKSNATPDYIAMYKTDRRTRELGNTGVRGVKEWCLKVRQNLLRSEIKLPVYP